MALGTADSQPQENTSCHIDTVVIAFADGLKAKTRKQLVAHIRRHLIRGNLCLHKHIERHVAVESIDNPVAVAERIWEWTVIACRLLTVRVAGQIQPVPRPPLTIMRRIQQPVDYFFECAVGVSSATKAAISSGAGGSPVRSKVTLRMRVRLSAAGEGAMCSASMRASRNLSMFVRGHDLSAGLGIAGCRIG